ncbi:signal peptide peptidase SppA [Campylobacter lari]|uniref:signal peptide peptidase SppA n=1 Tax=Campylobacter lari TaxID=201 RepID=UPI0008C70685|nr:signal peptide peptidase SppA [Campylobacter lari]EAH4935743.1 signal peptide peptidase SppA [Campylobacter lari]EAI0282043.1 signal peptide peptidase SppA [Campylobacter lari]EAJ0328961.1 signal peptide peptidase SppA [Campylobacter lari]EAJ0333926.1 signal peptide peptidase SppA [Campylobacter lari]EAJ5691329.1 signal peptide peptidase SppA [Campylobacter lari]
MQLIKSFFKGIGKIISFINTYFKTFVFLFIVFLILAPSGDNAKLSNANLAQINLKGEINDASTLLEQIYKLKDDNAIKGVLLFIDSPGGAFAPSMEIALAIQDLKAKKPVVAYAGGTIASGSYLSAVGANMIIANPASFVGSIGVIMQGFNASELAQKIGISDQTIKAGTYKEAGTFMRKWSEEEKEFLQNLANQSYILFTNFVAKNRSLDLNQTKSWADAKVFLANEALKLKLIDKVGNYELAKKEVEKLAKVQNPIWQKEDAIDKFLKRLEEQSASFFANALTQFFTHLNSQKIY